MDYVLIRSQRVPRGTRVSSVTLNGISGESYTIRATLGPLLFFSQCRYTASQYVGKNPRDTPLLRPTGMELTGLPPQWIQVGDHEVLLGDAECLARRATHGGVDVDFKVWPGLWHVFQAAARLVPEARDSIEELGQFVRKHLGPDPSGE